MFHAEFVEHGMKPNSANVWNARPFMYQFLSLKLVHKRAGIPFPSAIEFIAALQKLDLPDWRQFESAFVASNWRGWDWKIEATASSPPNAVIFRKKCNAVQFRRWNGAFPLPKSFETVESFQE